jgi:hypothetical protein
MEAAAIQDRLTERLLQELEDSQFLHLRLMNRLEQRIRSRDELERYISILVAKLEQTKFRSDTLLTRIEGLLKQLERIERREAEEEDGRDGRVGTSVP